MKKASPWAAVTLLAFVPLITMYVFPNFDNPLTTYLISFVTMIIPVIIEQHNQHESTKTRVAEAAEEASRIERQKWLPQAESACDRLITIFADTQKILRLTNCGCDQYSNRLPELAPEVKKSILNVVDGQCQVTSIALNSISNHITSALNDWTRFIGQNCKDGDCDRIFNEIADRKQELAVADQTESQPSFGKCGNHNNSNETQK